MWLKDTGILQKVRDDAMNAPNLIPDPILRLNEPLILKQLGIIMIFLAVGLFIGTIVFLVELFKRPKLNNTSRTVHGAKMITTPLTEALAIIAMNNWTRSTAFSSEMRTFGQQGRQGPAVRFEQNVHQ